MFSWLFSLLNFVWYFSTALGLMITTLIILFLYRRFTKKTGETRLHRPNWKKDVVYLVQFPRADQMRSISPFALKLETWLRLNKIQYESVYSLKFGSKGQIPYIELNGEAIPDSNIIIERLRAKFSVANIDDFDKEKAAVVHGFKQMLEFHTCVCGFYWRYALNMSEFVAKCANHSYPKFMTKIWLWTQPWGMKLRCSMAGISRHEVDEIWDFANKDLKALSDYLGEKEFLMGDAMNTIDCTLYGHLAQFLYIPLEIPMKSYMKRETPNLVEYMERIKAKIYPDWERLCSTECMEGNWGYDLEDPEKRK